MSLQPVDPVPFPFYLAIGEMCVSIDCRHEVLSTQLKKHYKDFLTFDPAQTNLVIEVEGDEESGEEDVAVQFDQPIIHLTSPGYWGEIDPYNRSGRLNLNRKRLFEGADYFIRVVFALLAFERGGLMIHAAGIARRGRVYLFLGHSGSGKTTVARFSTNYRVLNDDLVVLMPGQAGWQAYGTPFWNPTQVKPTVQDGPLKGLYFLVKDRKVFLEPAYGAVALAELLANIPVLATNPAFNPVLLERCARILASVDAFKLHFLKDDTFWNVID